jgi:hypothetical protein
MPPVRYELGCCIPEDGVVTAVETSNLILVDIEMERVPCVTRTESVTAMNLGLGKVNLCQRALRFLGIMVCGSWCCVSALAQLVLDATAHVNTAVSLSALVFVECAV